MTRKYEIKAKVKVYPGPLHKDDVRIVEAFTAEDAIVQFRVEMDYQYEPNGYTIASIQPIIELAQ